MITFENSNNSYDYVLIVCRFHIYIYMIDNIFFLNLHKYDINDRFSKVEMYLLQFQI